MWSDSSTTRVSSSRELRSGPTGGTPYDQGAPQRGGIGPELSGDSPPLKAIIIKSVLPITHEDSWVLTLRPPALPAWQTRFATTRLGQVQSKSTLISRPRHAGHIYIFVWNSNDVLTTFEEFARETLGRDDHRSDASSN